MVTVKRSVSSSHPIRYHGQEKARHPSTPSGGGGSSGGSSASGNGTIPTSVSGILNWNPATTYGGKYTPPPSGQTTPSTSYGMTKTGGLYVSGHSNSNTSSNKTTTITLANGTGTISTQNKPFISANKLTPVSSMASDNPVKAYDLTQSYKTQGYNAQKDIVKTPQLMGTSTDQTGRGKLMYTTGYRPGSLAALREEAAYNPEVTMSPSVLQNQKTAEVYRAVVSNPKYQESVDAGASISSVQNQMQSDYNMQIDTALSSPEYAKKIKASEKWSNNLYLINNPKSYSETALDTGVIAGSIAAGFVNPALGVGIAGAYFTGKGAYYAAKEQKLLAPDLEYQDVTLASGKKIQFGKISTPESRYYGNKATLNFASGALSIAPIFGIVQRSILKDEFAMLSKAPIKFESVSFSKGDVSLDVLKATQKSGTLKNEFKLMGKVITKGDQTFFMPSGKGEVVTTGQVINFRNEIGGTNVLGIQEFNIGSKGRNIALWDKTLSLGKVISRPTSNTGAFFGKMIDTSKGVSSVNPDFSNQISRNLRIGGKIDKSYTMALSKDITPDMFGNKRFASVGFKVAKKNDRLLAMKPMASGKTTIFELGEKQGQRLTGFENDLGSFSSGPSNFKVFRTNTHRPLQSLIQVPKVISKQFSSSGIMFPTIKSAFKTSNQNIAAIGSKSSSPFFKLPINSLGMLNRMDQVKRNQLMYSPAKLGLDLKSRSGSGLSLRQANISRSGSKNKNVFIESFGMAQPTDQFRSQTFQNPTFRNPRNPNLVTPPRIQFKTPFIMPPFKAKFPSLFDYQRRSRVKKSKARGRYTPNIAAIGLNLRASSIPLSYKKGAGALSLRPIIGGIPGLTKRRRKRKR